MWELYVGEDPGQSWKETALPRGAEADKLQCVPITHPFSKKLLLLGWDVLDEVGSGWFFVKGRAVYGSDNGGESFRMITASPHHKLSDSITTCEFAASSKESMAFIAYR